MNALSGWVACNVGRPVSQLAFLVGCGLWLIAGGNYDHLTLVLSILAITLTQMVLFAQDRITKAEHAKLDAIIHGTNADDRVAGIEREGE